MLKIQIKKERKNGGMKISIKLGHHVSQENARIKDTSFPPSSYKIQEFRRASSAVK